MTKQEQIIAIWDKLGTVIGWTETGWPKTITKEDCAEEIDKLYQCKNIIAKVKEANTHDKRSFEEAEAESKKDIFKSSYCNCEDPIFMNGVCEKCGGFQI